MGDLPTDRRIKWDMAVNLGHVLQIGLMVIAVLSAYFTLQGAVASNKDAITTETTARKTAIEETVRLLVEKLSAVEHVARKHAFDSAPHPEAERRISTMEAKLEAGLSELLRTTGRIERSVEANRDDIKTLVSTK